MAVKGRAGSNPAFGTRFRVYKRRGGGISTLVFIFPLSLGPELFKFPERKDRGIKILSYGGFNERLQGLVLEGSLCLAK